MVVMTKSQLLAKMNATYVSGGNITAKQVRDYQTDLIDSMFFASGFIGKEVTLNGSTFQDPVLENLNYEQFMLFDKGIELTTSIGTMYDSVTGTLTFPIAKSGTAKLFYKEN